MRRAAEQGCSDAQYGLGMLYQNGHGVPRDDDQAATWLRKALDQGYAGPVSPADYLAAPVTRQ